MRFLERFMANVENIPMIDSGLSTPEEMMLYVLIIDFILICTLLVFSLVTLVATWRIFAKAGIPGWYVLIPVYNVYVMYKHFWSVGAFKRYLVWSIIYGVITAVLRIVPLGDAVYSTLYIIGDVVSLLIFINLFGLNYRLAKSFDRGFMFTLGLAFLPPFFEWILGLGDCDYVGDAYDYYY